MSNSQSQDNKLLILNFTNNPVIPHPVPPQTSHFSAQWFTKMSGVLATSDTIFKPVD
jgi:hypothetical protein